LVLIRAFIERVAVPLSSRGTGQAKPLNPYDSPKPGLFRKVLDRGRMASSVSLFAE